MDLDIETSLTVSVATFLLLPILWIKVQTSKRIQPKYKRGIIMGLILLFALVVLCTKTYTEYEYYTDMFQLAQLLVCVLLFILVTRADWGERMYKLGIMIPVAVVILAFVALFVSESIRNYSPPGFIELHPPSPSAPMHMPSSPPLVNHLNNVKIFNIKKLTSQVGITVFAVLCVCLGV